MICNFALARHAPKKLYDICVIGSGPAGGALSNILAERHLRICVLESGLAHSQDFSDALRSVDCDGVQIRERSRERILGGTSTTWAGISSPLDPIDFSRRDWVPYSGWPITRDEIVPFYIEAAERFRFPKWERFETERRKIRRQSDVNLVWTELEEKLFLAAESPQNFGKELMQVYQHENVDVYTGCTVIRLEGRPSTACAEKAMVAAQNGTRFAVSARIFILACGGIENPRLLLNSTFACPTGLGNDRDLVGRYFMNHPKNNYGTIRLARPINEHPGYFGFFSLSDGCTGYVGLRLRDGLQRQLNVLNAYVRFEPVFNWSDKPGVEALLSLAKVSKRLFKRFEQESIAPLRNYSETADNSERKNKSRSRADLFRMFAAIGANAPSVSRYLYYRTRDRKSVKISKVHVRNFMEMAPAPENRVTLSARRDVFGSRLPSVSHRPGELDRGSIVAVHAALRREMQRLRWGSLVSDLSLNTEPWPIDYDASHHMGGTRMGGDPSTSVVNKDCRLHFCSNVYVAGASVLPTSGNANPTFTIVALAIRLARHLSHNFERA